MDFSKVYGLDFETGVDEDGNCTLELCSVSGGNNEKVYELDNEEGLVRFIAEIIISGNTYVVFNASFDIEIIITLLLKAQFKFITDEEKATHKTMKLLMSKKIYSLDTYFQYKKKLRHTRFIDLANLIVGEDLASIAEKFTNLRKGDYNVSKEDREVFKDYCLNDSRITRQAYINILKVLGVDALTIGGASFQLMLDLNFEGTKIEQFNAFRKVYGNISLEDDELLRKWYKGGMGWCSVDDRCETVINSYDIKSAYPYETTKEFPTFWGKVEQLGYAEPNEQFPFSFIHMKVTGQVKVNHIPVLPSRNIYGDSNIYVYDDYDVYIMKIYGEKSEYDWFMENMDIDSIEYISTIRMRKAIKNPLRKFTEKYYPLKASSVGIEREVYKRLLNSLTGKLGTNPIKTNILYKLDENYKLVRDKTYESITKTYAPHVVSVITSRVRCRCYEVDKLLRDTCTFRLYATDSVKFSSCDIKLEGNGKLGDWDIEWKDTDFIYVGLKTYMFDPYNKQDKRKVVCAGISKKYQEKITNEEFYATTKVDTLFSDRRGNGRVIYVGKKNIATTIKKPRRREEYEWYVKEKRRVSTKKNRPANNNETFETI